MQIQKIEIKEVINKAYPKEKVNRADIDLFKKHLAEFFEKINEQADEAHLKSLMQDLLNDSFYKGKYHIGPFGRNDMVIHTAKSPFDPIGVILEVKSIANKAEMISGSKPNAKAIHELILYYLTERITHNKHEIKQLIVTNIYEWFVFDANEFDKKIYRNTKIKKLYEQKVIDSKDNVWFYEEIRKLLGNENLSLDATYFDIRDFKQLALDSNNANDVKLIALYKILSPVHLLKLPFANDSNSLQPKFYAELLHLIGLCEYKDGSKKLISRKKEGERNVGSLIENTILNLERHDKIASFELLSRYGEKYQEQIYNVALELVITWINRILFLKLLEAQLSNYHKGDESYRFLNKEKIRDFKDLDNLFFGVLAIQLNERKPDVIKEFKNVPYLNSSLFEATELEKQTIAIDSLNYRSELPILTSSILRSSKNKLQSDALPTLDYLFEFLNAYDFSSESAEEIQEDNKPLINASVLGLIFEKINGYKDGSFFTPGFITMYMCRETIRRAVVQKFNDAKNWEIKEYGELYNKITDLKEANTIINSLKICDPAVGSGHFLVSALNEIISIKSDLNVLISGDGRTLRGYDIKVVNDELIVTDENKDPFKYNFHDARSQTVQQTLFHEKQTIIENCLFGVDINPNSVKICRLRLWIELLKNAYYKPTTNGQLELETLPNIDINIKTGNSLISRFALDADLKQALKKNNITIDAYRKAVDTYRNARDKKQKREMENIINTIKSNFRTEISSNSDEVKKLIKAEKDYNFKYESSQLFDVELSKDQIRDKQKLAKDIEKLKTVIEDFKSNKIYENAFEWRFEFPEVLNDEGGFVGFDVVIGNPPYGIKFQLNEINIIKQYYSSFEYQVNSYVLFFERGLLILRSKGFLDYITPATFTYQKYFKKIRSILKNNQIKRIRKFLYEVFEDADIGDSVSILTQKDETKESYIIQIELSSLKDDIFKEEENTVFYLNDNIFNLNNSTSFLKLTYDNSINLGDISKIIVGIKPYQVGKGVPKQLRETVENKIFTSNIQTDESFYLCINGKDFHRYGFVRKPQMYLKYGKWLAEPRESAPFFKEKIILRQTSDSIIAMIDNTKSINLNNVYNIGELDTNYELKYILGIINSRLINYFYQNISQEKGRVFAEVKKVYLEKIPIIKATFEEQLEVSNLVEKINIGKKSDSSFNSKILESQIDQLVYQLYNLTPEEIKIVEGEV